MEPRFIKEKLLETYKGPFTVNGITDIDQVIIDHIKTIINKEINSTTIRIAIDKIKKPNPERYHVLSWTGIKESGKKESAGLMEAVKIEHGCQLIINGAVPTLKYYLRLITSLDGFIENHNEAIGLGSKLKKAHKDKWGQLIEKYFSN